MRNTIRIDRKISGTYEEYYYGGYIECTELNKTILGYTEKGNV